VSAARGHFDVLARASHRADRGWTLSGGATLHDADLDVGLPMAFTDIEADLRFSGAHVEVVRLDGRAGGGDFDVTGRIDLDRGPTLGWNMREVSMSLSEGIEARASGRGEVGGTWQVLTVTGQIEVIKALYDQPIALADFLPWFRERIRPVPRVKPPATDVRLDLNIRAPDGLFVDNNVAKVEARGELRVTGPTDKPSVIGAVDVLEGEVTFRNRRFTITSGSVIFDDAERVNPRLEFSAESLIVTSDADYVVGVGRGPPKCGCASRRTTAPLQNDVLGLIPSADDDRRSVTRRGRWVSGTWSGCCPAS
jgi:autotransporter translocation and assembly factor TamB